jgi:Domain of unknown function (DUF6458)
VEECPYGRSCTLRTDQSARRGSHEMGYGGIGFGIFLVALGAILRYAVTADVAGIDIQTVGVILMVAGIVLFLLSLFFVVWARQQASSGPPPPPPPPGY